MSSTGLIDLNAGLIDLNGGVGAGCGSNPVSRARAPQHSPPPHPRTTANAAIQAAKQLSAGLVTPRSPGCQVRVRARTRGEAARERQGKGASFGPVGTPGQARPWGTVLHAPSRHMEQGTGAPPQGSQEATARQAPSAFTPGTARLDFNRARPARNGGPGSSLKWGALGLHGSPP